MFLFQYLNTHCPFSYPPPRVGQFTLYTATLQVFLSHEILHVKCATILISAALFLVRLDDMSLADIRHSTLSRTFAQRGQHQSQLFIMFCIILCTRCVVGLDWNSWQMDCLDKEAANAAKTTPRLLLTTTTSTWKYTCRMTPSLGHKRNNTRANQHAKGAWYLYLTSAVTSRRPWACLECQYAPKWLAHWELAERSQAKWNWGNGIGYGLLSCQTGAPWEIQTVDWICWVVKRNAMVRLEKQLGQAERAERRWKKKKWGMNGAAAGQMANRLDFICFGMLK